MLAARLLRAAQRGLHQAALAPARARGGAAALQLTAGAGLRGSTRQLSKSAAGDGAGPELHIAAGAGAREWFLMQPVHSLPTASAHL